MTLTAPIRASCLESCARLFPRLVLPDGTGAASLRRASTHVMDASDWDRRYQGSELLWGAGPNRFLAEEVDDLAPGRALDLAAGEGRNAIWLAERGWRVRAIDFSPVALERARRLASDRGVEVDFVEADLTTYQPETQAFDLVAVFYLHVPWRELEPILRRAAAAVAPGGTFLLVGHDLSNL
jgi:SAM-dependent methyltransferase